jgi:hypothetical protein
MESECFLCARRCGELRLAVSLNSHTSPARLMLIGELQTQEAMDSNSGIWTITTVHAVLAWQTIIHRTLVRIQ